MQPPKSSPWNPAGHPAYLLGRAARLFTRTCDARLRALGFTSAYVPVVRTLADGAARSQTELALHALVEQPTMAALLARMERDGIVKRVPNPADGRSVLYSLTPRAHAKVAAVRQVIVRGADEMFAGLSAAEVAKLGALLARAIANLEAVAVE